MTAEIPVAAEMPVPRVVAAMSAPKAVVAVAVLISLTAAVAVFIGQGSGSSGSGAPDAGGIASTRPVVPFTLPELRTDRPDVVLAAAPGRPTVVNFFAAWCEPCKRELPALRDAATAHPEVGFLGVDHQDSREDAIEMLDRLGVTYPAAYDPRGDVAASFFVRGLPATAFIDRDGRIVDFHQGELSAAELDERLDRLTSRKPTP